MENLAHIGLMSHYYTQLHIVPLSHFRIMLFKLENGPENYKSGK